MDNETPVVPAEATAESKNIALLVWIGTIFFGFIPSLIVYLVKKDDAYITDQAKETLNWSITALIGYVAGWILMFVLIGFLIVPIVLILNLVFCVMGAIACSSGKNFRCPFALRLIK